MNFAQIQIFGSLLKNLNNFLTKESFTSRFTLNNRDIDTKCDKDILPIKILEK